MLDTNARKYVQPMFEGVATFFINLNISATQVTFIALIIGIISSVLLYFKFFTAAIILLWISGFLDAVDGTVARKTKTKSKIGGFLDVIFDRVVEIGIIIALTMLNRDLAIINVILLSCIVLSMTVFLMSGALVEKESKKVFYYQAGVAERTEGFIFFTLAIIFFDYANIILLIFAAAIAFTAIQRINETIKYLKD